MKAVAYYRTRPSEPGASDLALLTQQAAVRAVVERHGYTLVAEFIEREGEEGSGGSPAYVDALRTAISQKEDTTPLDVTLLVASNAGIGSGEPFRTAPHVKGDDGLLHQHLNATLLPPEPEIDLPSGVPGGLYLYADFRPRQLDTPLYLCNAGTEVLAEVEVTIDNISLFQFHRLQGPERWATVQESYGKQFEAVPPGRCVLINTLDHVIADEVNRYCLSFTGVEGRRTTMEAHDRTLTASWLEEDPANVWVRFGDAK